MTTPYAGTVGREATQLTRCRGCGSSDLTVVLDLGMQSACDHFPPADDVGPDPRWPLALALCGECGLVQLEDRKSVV